jgi:hypothetical protein
MKKHKYQHMAEVKCEKGLEEGDLSRSTELDSNAGLVASATGKATTWVRYTAGH